MRRLYILWTHPIFRESVQRLLKHPEIDWVGANSDYSNARKEIKKLQPDTILVEETGGGENPEMLEIFENSPWDVNVIGLNLSDNRINIYHRAQQWVGKAEDLVRLIIHDPIMPDSQE